MAERQTLTLSLDRVMIDVVLTSSDGKESKYVLLELSGKERNKYLNKMSNRIKVTAGGNTTLKSFDGFQADLLCASLVDEEGDHVTKDVIEDLPSSTQAALFTKAQEISGLNEDESKKKDDEEGND